MKKLIYSALFLATAFMVGCEKSDEKEFSDSKQYLALYQPLATHGEKDPHIQFVTLTSEPTGSFDVAVMYGSPKYNDGVVTATLGLATDSFNIYNAANGGIYTLLPASTYQLPANITISKGNVQTLAAVTLQTLSIAQLPKLRYVLPIAINASSDSINRSISTVFYEVKVAKQPGLLSLPIANGNNAVNLNVIAPDNPGDAATYNLKVKFAGDSAALSDIPVEVFVDNVAGAGFVASHAGYAILPSSAYVLTSGTGTIVKGTSEILIPLKINTNQIDPTKKYILPISLKDVVGYFAQTGKQTAFLEIKVVDKYEGTYRAVGTRTNLNADGTVASSSPVDQVKKLKLFAPKVYDVSAIANLGDDRPNSIFRITLKADNTGNFTGYIDAPGNKIEDVVGKISKVDPVTKTWTVNYKYTNSNGTYREMVETWTKL